MVQRDNIETGHEGNQLNEQNNIPGVHIEIISQK